MIDNFDIIRNLLYFSSIYEEIFFHLQIIRRGKDYSSEGAKNKLITSYLVTSRKHFDLIRDEVILLCEHYGARAYINVAGKNLHKLNLLILRKLADNIYSNINVDPRRVLDSACGELKSDIPKWIIDIDDISYKELVLEELNKIQEEEYPSCKIYAEIPTLHGCHLITSPFNRKRFSEKFNNIDIHKNNPTVLYIPNSLL